MDCKGTDCCSAESSCRRLEEFSIGCAIHVIFGVLQLACKLRLSSSCYASDLEKH
jgi:hypothetical protein